MEKALFEVKYFESGDASRAFVIADNETEATQQIEGLYSPEETFTLDEVVKHDKYGIVTIVHDIP